jgi:periplasmic divalent cation tolerance protein
MTEMQDVNDGERVVVAFTTVPDEATGARIGRLLVEEGLAACVSRVPGIVSTYLWEGALREDPEVLLVIKTVSSRVAEVERRLADVHPYDVPELVAVDASAVGGPYARWVRSVTKGSEDAGPSRAGGP